MSDLSLKLPSEEFAIIEQHARRLGVSKSAIVRMLLRTGSVPKFKSMRSAGEASSSSALGWLPVPVRLLGRAGSPFLN